jgi:nitroreductase
MEFFDVIRDRYSHKARFDAASPVPEEDLARIVLAGMLSPSANNRQSPEFVIVSDPALARRIGDLTTNTPLRTAPAMIIVLTQPRFRLVLDAETECLIADFAAASQSILLAATALGYCCGWVDSPFADDAVQRAASALLGLPDDRAIAMAIPIGRAAEQGVRRTKKPFAQRASWNRYAVER